MQGMDGSRGVPSPARRREEPDLGRKLRHELRLHLRCDLTRQRERELMAQPEFEQVAQQREQPKRKPGLRLDRLPEYDWPVLRRWPLNRQQRQKLGAHLRLNSRPQPGRQQKRELLSQCPRGWTSRRGRRRNCPGTQRLAPMFPAGFDSGSGAGTSAASCSRGRGVRGVDLGGNPATVLAARIP
jgi:hypothetical protein